MSVFAKLVLAAVLFAQPTFVNAADELLNGGDVIACPGYEVPSYQSLDIFEGANVYGLKPTEFRITTDYKVILNQIIDRLAKVDAERANRYRIYLNKFEEQARIVPGEFSNIRDEGFHTVPEGCSLKQAAAQFRKHTPEGIKYIFNQTIWNEMKAPTRAALVLHELIYREALLPQYNAKSSARVRYFNAFLHSSKMNNIDFNTYVKAATFSGFHVRPSKNQ
ncbi:hypothetical protein [Bdellovibrio sp. HCB274]|uniref:hypothetical protein n=1 Tax=Bdellovibrio sp. HCB274 TaxID=3394361 RepID=UPI0039B5BE99